MFRYCKQSVALMALAAAIVLCCAPLSLAKKPGGGGGGSAYQIISFEPFGSTTASSISDINQGGTAAIGFAELPGGEYRSAHFDIATQSYTPFPTGVFLSGINNLNQMVGVAGDNSDMGAYWDSPLAEPVTLPPLSGDVESAAVGINDDGVILGISGQRGVAWRVTKDAQNTLVVDGPVELPPLYAGAVYAYGRDINETADGMAQIVGHSGDQAVVWTIGLDSAGALVAPAAPVTVGPQGASSSDGFGINNLGDVSGDFKSSSGSFFLPFGALAGQDTQLLPLPRNTWWGRAFDINDQGEIVGQLNVAVRGSKHPPGIDVAYLWKVGEAIDLNSQIPAGSGWELHSATDISNGGIIGGSGQFDGSGRGFLLIPNSPSGASISSIPEPSAVGLAVIGLIGLTMISRQRTQGDLSPCFSAAVPLFDSLKGEIS